MKFKMRVLHFAKAGNADAIAAAIAKDQGANCDQIPPAYNCENEKLIFVCAEGNKKSDKAVVEFVKYLNTDRVKNIAFLSVGGAEAVDELKALASSNGINVVGDTHVCQVKGGLFKKGKVTDDDIKAAVAWASKIVDSLAN